MAHPMIHMTHKKNRHVIELWRKQRTSKNFDIINWKLSVKILKYKLISNMLLLLRMQNTRVFHICILYILNKQSTKW